MTKFQANTSMILYTARNLQKWRNLLCVKQFPPPPRCARNIFRGLVVSRFCFGCVILRRSTPYPVEGHGVDLRTFFYCSHPG